MRDRHPHHLEARFHEITRTEAAGDLLEACTDAGCAEVYASPADLVARLDQSLTGGAR